MADIFNEYQANDWQGDFHTCNDPWIALVGGKGSGKSRAMIEELKACALEFPKTTYIIGRKTLPSLKDTTWKDFVTHMPLGLMKDHNKADRVITLINDSVFLGRSMDEPKKFDSIQIAGFGIDEAEEVEEEFYNTLIDRTREFRIIDGKKIFPRYRGILSLNPAEQDHWIYRRFVEEKRKRHRMFISSTLQNLDNLPPDYVENLKANYTEDFQQRIIHGLWGKVHKGRAVFPEFSRGIYIKPVAHEKKMVIFRGWDFGYNRPSCVFFQFINGRAVVLASVLGKQIYLDDFVKEKVWPLQNEIFPEHPLFADWCDPHGSDETDKGKSSVDILNDLGIYPKYRRTKIQEGIKAIRSLLNSKGNDGNPQFVIHPRCRNLIEGFRGGYHRLDGENDPEKDGFYDHEMDALRYGIVNLVRRYTINLLQERINSSDNVFIHPQTGRRIEL